jgi:hypothetical protein
VNWTRFSYPFVIIAVVILIELGSPHADLAAQTRKWSEPISISQISGSAWFPDLAVDSMGNIHVTSCLQMLTSSGTPLR